MPRVFLDIDIAGEPVGRLVIDLFHAQCPRTAENFRQLCTGEHNGLSYAQTPFHRVIDEFMIQGGDIAKGDGTGTISTYGREFEDENLNWCEMDASGLVCSANRGKDTNGSQLVSGEETLQMIAKVAVDKNDCPLEPVLVSRSGELERRNREEKRDSMPQNFAPEKSNDRGRRRKSDQDRSDDEMDTGGPPDRQRRNRRQSDNVVDEGIRGRPRLRSVSRSSSNPIIEEQDDVSERLPFKMHKRKRSPSPSRHVDRQSDTDHERRRRSLPNQYSKDDGDRYRPSPRQEYRQFGRRIENRSHRPSRDDYSDGGRLGSGDMIAESGSSNDRDPPVKFKGRGAMKYREPDRAW